MKKNEVEQHLEWCECREFVYDELPSLRVRIAALEAVVVAAKEYKAVAIFRQENELCYHCGADENHEHGNKCQYMILANRLRDALEAIG